MEDVVRIELTLHGDVGYTGDAKTVAGQAIDNMTSHIWWLNYVSAWMDTDGNVLDQVGHRR